ARGVSQGQITRSEPRAARRSGIARRAAQLTSPWLLLPGQALGFGAGRAYTAPVLTPRHPGLLSQPAIAATRATRAARRACTRLRVTFLNWSSMGPPSSC